MRAHFILYVADQARSTEFYRTVLGQEPTLDVPGMTEFQISDGAVLGLMPESSVRALLGGRLPALEAGRGAPEAEVYLVVPEPAAMHARALGAGAVELSPLLPRDWGHVASYCLDLDGHVIVFAAAIEQSRAEDAWTR